MIYDFTEPAAPIRQGDVFISLPSVTISLDRMLILNSADQSTSETKWQCVVEDGNDSPEVTLIASARSVRAIVLTQNCDAMRSEYITFAEIVPFSSVLGESVPSSHKKWQSKIVQHAKNNTRYFYLPESSSHGIGERSAADFRMVFRLPRVELERLHALRRCRLNQVATEHFRESLAHFVRRYPYNEWYPLTKEEFAEYSHEYKVDPYEWQQ